jgi:hypothetical protein
MSPAFWWYGIRMTEEQTPRPAPYDHQKWLHELKREDAQRAFDHWDDQFNKLNDAAIKAGDVALRSGMLINGGAAVSVLAFIGGLATKDLITMQQLSKVADSLEIFAIGVALALTGLGLSYVTHFFGAGRVGSYTRNSEPPWIVPGPKTRRYAWATYSVQILAVFAGLGCIILFVCGMFSVRNAIGQLGTH